jgi:hypothetical protein
MGIESFPEIKLPDRGDDHSLRASTEIEEKNGAIPVLHICAFMALLQRELTLGRTVLEIITHKQRCAYISEDDMFIASEHHLGLLLIGPSILVYIQKENQKMHPNDHFIVMSSQTLLHVSAS